MIQPSLPQLPLNPLLDEMRWIKSPYALEEVYALIREKSLSLKR